MAAASADEAVKGTVRAITCAGDVRWDSGSYRTSHRDFFEMRINIVRSVIDQVIGNCKTEASRKPVVMNEHIAQVLKAWRQESMYTSPTDWVWASPEERPPALWLATVMRYYI